MRVSSRIDARSLLWALLAAALCAAIGVTSGVKPALGLEVAFGLAFVVVVVGSLTLGVAIFTVGSFLGIVNTGGTAVSVVKVAGLLLFISWFAASTSRRERLNSLSRELPVLVFAVVGLVCWSGMSVAWAQEAGTAVTATERYLLNVLLLPIVFAAVRNRQQFVWIIGAFVLGAAASAAYGIVHPPATEGRLTGTLGDPNEQAAVFVAAMMLAVGVAAAMPKWSTRRFLAVAGGVICAFGLVNTVSRGGLIALGCALVAGIVFGGRWRARMVLLTAVAVAGAGLYFTVLAPLAERQHLSSTSSTGRTDLWKVGWRMYGANPVIGVGSGNFQTASVRYVQQAGALTRADLIVNTPHVTHNQYLDILDELGPVGLFSFVVAVGASLAAAIAAARRYAEVGDVPLELLSRVLVFAIVGILAADFFLSNQYSKQLWLLLALPPPLLALARSHRK